MLRFTVTNVCKSGLSALWRGLGCGLSHTVDVTHRLRDQGLGQGTNVVLDLKVLLAPGSKVFFDKLFTSFPLLERLSEKGIGGAGMVRNNR